MQRARVVHPDLQQVLDAVAVDVRRQQCDLAGRVERQRAWHALSKADVVDQRARRDVARHRHVVLIRRHPHEVDHAVAVDVDGPEPELVVEYERVACYRRGPVDEGSAVGELRQVRAEAQELVLFRAGEGLDDVGAAISVASIAKSSCFEFHKLLVEVNTSPAVKPPLPSETTAGARRLLVALVRDDEICHAVAVDVGGQDLELARVQKLPSGVGGRLGERRDVVARGREVRRGLQLILADPELHDIGGPAPREVHRPNVGIVRIAQVACRVLPEG